MKRTVGVIVLVLLFLGAVVGGYIYFSGMFSKEKTPEEEQEAGIGVTADFFTLRIYYPADNRLQLEERMAPRKTSLTTVAEATLEEYLKGPAGSSDSGIPRNVELLGLYRGADRILYVNLSDEFRRNFQGDALSEYLLLKGLYESLISNVEDIQDVKVLIEGKEVETLGGHLYLFYPLKEVVSSEF
ncbi:MAG: GerMN domain-containing protein [Nitrospirota bacterium]